MVAGCGAVIAKPEGREGVRQICGCQRFLAERFSQNSSQRPLIWQHRNAMMALAPRTVQCIPERLSRCPIIVLQPASITPDPTNNPCLRKSA
jgi:hypothetical protein